MKQAVLASGRTAAVTCDTCRGEHRRREVKAGSIHKA
jgi:hypothetical protein